jgi:hypothetical protein
MMQTKGSEYLKKKNARPWIYCQFGSVECPVAFLMPLYAISYDYPN